MTTLTDILRTQEILHARNEFRRIVAEELPKVKVKVVNGEYVKATQADADLSRKLSTRLAELHAVMEGGAK